ncbi:hypothetical protein CB1_001389006 [Camelus ferus]|nr:hypothetical protein CB1_001389006 [Camelus ferus]
MAKLVLWGLPGPDKNSLPALQGCQLKAPDRSNAASALSGNRGRARGEKEQEQKKRMILVVQAGTRTVSSQGSGGLVVVTSVVEQLSEWEPVQLGATPALPLLSSVTLVIICGCYFLQKIQADVAPSEVTGSRDPISTDINLDF